MDRPTESQSSQEAPFTYSRIKSLRFETGDRPLVYPNPAGNTFRIQDFTKVSKLSIRDLSGKEVYRSASVDPNGIDISSLSSGIHFVEINWQDGQKTTSKLIVNH